VGRIGSLPRVSESCFGLLDCKRSVLEAILGVGEILIGIDAFGGSVLKTLAGGLDVLLTLIGRRGRFSRLLRWLEACVASSGVGETEAEAEAEAEIGQFVVADELPSGEQRPRIVIADCRVKRGEHTAADRRGHGVPDRGQLRGG
jgi:hypothetical protein